jgi:partner of Y14 and mago protein
MEGYVVTDNGEKVLPGSRRPDGTIRKERRIRAGYTPQDEQPVYQSVGVMVRLRCLLG